ncbi:TOBE domain-containing protein [Neisseria sp.]|uniref:TOBE domain-containing protein n=1 Tax=Neisseria sp. TaxID=192066 RepID=UPI002899EC40|nr:TOBE domain-containing protein [Neisseria sp.]
MKISARNQLTGRITHIEDEGGLCLLTLTTENGMNIQAQISRQSRHRLKLALGSTAVAMIKASGIIIATDLAPMELSAENCISGTVSLVEKGSVNNVVTLDIGGGISLCATITLYSSESLALEPGNRATAVFNANQVVLGVLV